MKIGSKILKGSALLSLGQIVGYGATFVRNIILARVLSKSDFGIAAALSITITAFELSGKMSIGQQVVQAKDGDNEDFQATAHLCQFLAGCCGALLIAAFGGPMADLFKVPQARWAFMVVALLGLTKGLEHLDVTRRTRFLSFTKRVVLDVVPDVLVAAAALPVVLWLKDYRAVVWLLLAKAVLYLALSHLLAERPYRWKLNRDYAKGILIFGWPLVINALLMFGYQQGDQLLIGANYSMAALAQYSLAVSITMIPGYMFQSVLNSMMLPLLSQVQDDPDKYRHRYVFCAELATVVGVLLACFLILGGELVIVTAFGQKYAGSGAIVGWLAVANAFRIIRSVSSSAAMARGDTVNNMVSNLFRVSSLGLAALAIFYKEPIIWVAACGLCGEILAMGASWHRLSKKCGIPVWVGLKSAGAGGILIAFSAILMAGGTSHSSWPVTVLICVVACSTAFLLMWRLFGELRRHTLEVLGNSPAISLFVRLLDRCGSS